MITKRENIKIETDSPEETKLFGESLAKILIVHDVLSFGGVLGAGKTCLIKGIASGLGIEDDAVKSPSFTLINEYEGKIPLYHFDLYRMKDSTELHNIGWDDYLMRDGIVAVEWGEKAEDQMPENRIDIDIEIISETKRKLKIRFNGQSFFNE